MKFIILRLLYFLPKSANDLENKLDTSNSKLSFQNNRKLYFLKIVNYEITNPRQTRPISVFHFKTFLTITPEISIYWILISFQAKVSTSFADDDVMFAYF